MTAEAKTCLKCQHLRLATDPGPDYECPKCGAVYAKVEAAMRARQEAGTLDVSPRSRSVEATSRYAAPASELVEPEDHRRLAEMRERERTPRNLAHLVYALFLLPLGASALIGVVIAYTMRSSRDAGWVESHFHWQIGTFWRSIIASVVLFVLLLVLGGSSLMTGVRSRDIGVAMAHMVGVGAVVLVVSGLFALWWLYRNLKGWWLLFRHEEVG